MNGPRTWRPLVSLVAILLAGGLLWIQRPGSDGVLGRGSFLIELDGGDRPTPAPAESAVPLGTPTTSSLSDSYAFMATQDDGETPVAYDPCRTIHVVINARTVPDGAQHVVHEALAEMTTITGLQFVVEGEVTEVPQEQRSPFQPDRYGDRWAPVLIAWSDSTELPGLDGVAGIGGSAPIRTDDGTRVYVSGMIGLNGPSFDQFMSYPAGSEHARGVVLHELGHLLGLAHVDDPIQLMYHDNLGVDIPQAGDRAGLALLAQGVCVPEL